MKKDILLFIAYILLLTGCERLYSVYVNGEREKVYPELIQLLDKKRNTVKSEKPQREPDYEIKIWNERKEQDQTIYTIWKEENAYLVDITRDYGTEWIAIEDEDKEDYKMLSLLLGKYESKDKENKNESALEFRVSEAKPYGTGISFKKGAMLMSNDTHMNGKEHSVVTRNWKPYESIKVLKNKGKIQVFYDEQKASNEKSSFFISFRDDEIKSPEKNIEIYLNGKEVDFAGYEWGIE